MARGSATRVFAAEFNRATESFRDNEGAFSPLYLITHLGALVNRCFVVGILTDKFNRGTPEDPWWNARVSDPTGVFYVSAGQFQKEAARAFGTLEPPIEVAILGKARSVQREDGSVLNSLLPESVEEAPPGARLAWTLETARHMKRRIEAMLFVEGMAEPRETALLEAGFGRRLAMGAVLAARTYGTRAVGGYAQLLYRTLEGLAANGGKSPGARAPQRTWTPPSDATRPTGGGHGPADGRSLTGPPPQAEPVDWRPETARAAVLDAIDRLSMGTVGASYDAVLRDLLARGVPRDLVEEAVERLEDAGEVIEPIIGTLKHLRDG